jgi:hypothetical protein
MMLVAHDYYLLFPGFFEYRSDSAQNARYFLAQQLLSFVRDVFSQKR